MSTHLEPVGAKLNQARRLIEMARRLLLSARCPYFMVADGATPQAKASLKQWNKERDAFCALASVAAAEDGRSDTRNRDAE